MAYRSCKSPTAGMTFVPCSRKTGCARRAIGGRRSKLQTWERRHPCWSPSWPVKVPIVVGEGRCGLQTDTSEEHCCAMEGPKAACAVALASPRRRRGCHPTIAPDEEPNVSIERHGAGKLPVLPGMTGPGGAVAGKTRERSWERRDLAGLRRGSGAWEVALRERDAASERLVPALPRHRSAPR
jgi:hypothetical protein